MKRIGFIISTILIVCMSFNSFLFGQTKIWGAGANIGHTEGTFQNNFIDTGSIGNYSPVSWTALSVYDNGGMNQPGNAYWKRSMLGYSQGNNTLDTIPIPSPSQLNGVAIFDSDYMNNSGLGSSLAPHKGMLISPRINLTAYIDSSLMLHFFSKYDLATSSKFSVSISIDDGLSWLPEIDITILQDANIASWVRLNLSTFLTGASSLDSCRLAFIFEGNNYFTIIDDCYISITPEYDLAVARANPTSIVLEEQGNYIKVGNHQYISSENLSYCANDPICKNQWIWGGRIINYGAKDLYPSDSIKMKVHIDFIEPFTGALFPSIYVDSILVVDTLKGMGQNSTFVSKRFNNFNNLIFYNEGIFRVQYRVEHNHLDAFTDNDTIYYTFHSHVDNSFLGSRERFYESKVGLNSNNHKVVASTAIFPKDSILSSFEYGTLFYNSIPSSGSYSVRIDSVDFCYYIPEYYTGDTSVRLFVLVDAFFDDGDGMFNNAHTELITIGLGVVDLTGLGTTQAKGTYGFATFSSMLDPVTGNLMGDLDKGFYLVTIMQNPSLQGTGPLFNDSTGIWIGADYYNYALNTLSSSSSQIIPQASLAILTNAAGHTVVDWKGDHLGLAPSIGIHTSKPSYISVEDIQVPSLNNCLLYPNPTTDYLNVHYYNPSPKQDLTFQVLDVQGRVLKSYTTLDVSDKTYMLAVDDLPMGTYVLELRQEGALIGREVFLVVD